MLYVILKFYLVKFKFVKEHTVVTINLLRIDVLGLSLSWAALELLSLTEL